LAGIITQQTRSRGDPLDEGELDETDNEPSLGFLENHPYVAYGWSLPRQIYHPSGSEEGLCQDALFDVEEQCDDKGDTSDSGIAEEESRMEQHDRMIEYSMKTGGVTLCSGALERLMLASASFASLFPTSAAARFPRISSWLWQFLLVSSPVGGVPEV
jgi:hypothetical protein